MCHISLSTDLQCSVSWFPLVIIERVEALEEREEWMIEERVDR